MWAVRFASSRFVAANTPQKTIYIAGQTEKNFLATPISLTFLCMGKPKCWLATPNPALRISKLWGLAESFLVITHVRAYSLKN